MNDIIYFDNAATSWPKPNSVIEALTDALKYRSGNPGRGSHILSSSASELVYDTRETAALMFDAEAENVVFTLNATHALNYAIKGLVRSGWNILIDNYAHNAAYRPAVALTKNGFCSIEVYDASINDDTTVENVRRKIIHGRTLVIATHRSNISSKTLPIERIGDICRKTGCPFVVDASQSAGHIPISLKKSNITALCMPGHKGLYGIMGCGMLISSPDARYNTLIEGGAGIASLEKGMPDVLPERLEAGTVALPAIASLKAGIEYVLKTGYKNIEAREKRLGERFAYGLKQIGGVKIYGENKGAVISFTKYGLSPAETGEKLNERNICVRTGYHCAPLAHNTVGSIEKGSVRVSFSHMNTLEEVDTVLDVISEIK